MRKLYPVIATVLLLFVVAATLYLRTPAAPPLDREAAIARAAAFEARIIRDGFGVPHIYGVRNADVAFGLAYAHAEDDWPTIEEVIRFSRGMLAQSTGKDGAVTDYLIATIGVVAAVDEKYESDLSPETREIAEAYADGVNFWCAEQRGRCGKDIGAVTGKDIVAGFVSRTPFFYGFEDHLKAIFEGEIDTDRSIKEAFLRIPQGGELGSNAMAVSPTRTDDGFTRLMVNSHQPYEGPVAWYEARVKSDEGWDMIGGIFPGAPLILHGARPELAWAFTVNKPDLVDVYELTTNNPKKPTQYKVDGEWRDFERGKAQLRVKLFGPFSLPVTRETYRTVHGPAFITDHGVYAVSFAGDRDVRAIEQWRRMNMATNFDEWQDAMALQGIPSFNVLYADRAGNIGYFYNAAIPVRVASTDWTLAQPGDKSALVWQGALPFGSAPSVVNPATGYVGNSNNNPYEAAAPEDAPNAEDFPPHYGIDMRTTNRGLRLQELYGADDTISAEEFANYKMDDLYAEGSRVVQLIRNITADIEETDDTELIAARDLLKSWDRSTARDNRAAPLAVLTGTYAMGAQINGEGEDLLPPLEALQKAISVLNEEFGRIDPEWGELAVLKRGDIALPLDGGPDTLRAVYALQIDGAPFRALAGDTYIMDVGWSPEGAQSIRTIHQYGAATVDPSSPHFADQAPLFQAEEWKTPPMTLEEVLAEATRDYQPGR